MWAGEDTDDEYLSLRYDAREATIEPVEDKLGKGGAVGYVCESLLAGSPVWMVYCGGGGGGGGDGLVGGA